MGGCCSHPAVVPQLPPPPSNIVRLTPKTDPVLLENIIVLMATSFCGSTVSAPEGGLSWAFDPTEGFEAPLKEPPSEQRMKFFTWIIRFACHMALPHCSSFCLMKGGEPVAATFTFPPSSRKIYKETICDMAYMGMKHGFPKEVTYPRMDAMGREMAKLHNEVANDPHWYIFCFAVDPECQGQGAGRELMEWMTKCADHTGDPLYLEVSSG